MNIISFKVLNLFMQVLIKLIFTYIVTFSIASASEQGDKHDGFDFTDTIMILQEVDDQHLVYGLPVGFTIDDMDPNYGFTIFYKFLSKYGSSMVPLEIPISNPDHTFIVIKPKQEFVFYLADYHLITDKLVVPIDPNDYDLIVSFLDSASNSRLSDIEDLKEFYSKIRSTYDGNNIRHPKYETQDFSGRSSDLEISVLKDEHLVVGSIDESKASEEIVAKPNADSTLSVSEQSEVSREMKPPSKSSGSYPNKDSNENTFEDDNKQGKVSDGFTFLYHVVFIVVLIYLVRNRTK